MTMLYRVLVLALFVAAGALLATAIRAEDPHDTGCVQALVTNRWLVFANECSPTDSFSLPIKSIQLPKGN